MCDVENDVTRLDSISTVFYIQLVTFKYNLYSHVWFVYRGFNEVQLFDKYVRIRAKEIILHTLRYACIH